MGQLKSSTKPLRVEESSFLSKFAIQLLSKVLIDSIPASILHFTSDKHSSVSLLEDFFIGRVLIL